MKDDIVRRIAELYSAKSVVTKDLSRHSPLSAELVQQLQRHLTNKAKVSQHLLQMFNGKVSYELCRVEEDVRRILKLYEASPDPKSGAVVRSLLESYLVASIIVPPAGVYYRDRFYERFEDICPDAFLYRSMRCVCKLFTAISDGVIPVSNLEELMVAVYLSLNKLATRTPYLRKRKDDRNVLKAQV